MAAGGSIIQDFRGGDERALKGFVQEHGKPLRFFAYKLIRNKEAAEEIVADSFFKLWRGREGFADADKVKAFLYISTRNACYDYLGSPKNRVHHDGELAEQLQHPQKDLLAQLIEAEVVEAIYREIDNLPDQQAAVFRMGMLEGMSTEEIGAALGISANAVFLARSRALKHLRAVFKGKELLWYLAVFHAMDAGRWVD